MGKKSRREREKIGRAEISDKRYVANQLSGQASSESERVAGAKSLLPNWKTEEEAHVGLQNAGFLLSKLTTSLDTTIFCSDLRQNLETKHNVVDCTHLVPLGPGGDHHALPTQAQKILVQSSKDQSYFVFVRTRANTPAFLAGTLVYLTAAMGSVAAASNYFKSMDSPSPAALVINAGNLHLIPTQAFTSQHTAPIMVSALIRKLPEKAVCIICEKSFFKIDEDTPVSVSSAISGGCGHMMHVGCFRRDLALRGNEAKQCRACKKIIPEAVIPEMYQGDLSELSDGDKPRFTAEADDLALFRNIKKFNF